MQIAGEFGVRSGGGFAVRTPGGFAANTHISVLYRLALLDIFEANALRYSPVLQRCTDVFRPVIAANHLRPGTPLDDFFQEPDDTQRRQRAIHPYKPKLLDQENSFDQREVFAGVCSDCSGAGENLCETVSMMGAVSSTISGTFSQADW